MDGEKRSTPKLRFEEAIRFEVESIEWRETVGSDGE